MKMKSIVNSVFTLLMCTSLSLSLFADDSYKNSDFGKKKDAAHRRKSGGKDKKSSQYIDKIMSKLSKDEKLRLRELRTNDPAAFREEMGKIIKKSKQGRNKRDPEMRNMIKSYHNASDEDKPAIKQKITELVRKQFDKKMDVNRKNYEKAQKRLQELKNKLTERENNADVIIQNRVDFLTQNPALHW